MSQFVAVGTVLIMVILAALLGIWSIVDELRKLQRPRRARTCGTCRFCKDTSKDGRNGYCTRRPYPANPTYDSGNPNFPTATRTLVELDWPGCGESEEKS